MTELMDFILAPLAHPFMVRALAAVLMVGVTSGVVGIYVVLRGMAFFGDALAHAILPGVAIGFLVGGGVEGPLFWWGLVTAVFTALGIGAISKRAKIKEDTAIGIVFAGMFALGVALISTRRNYAVDLTNILFGNVLAVSRQDLWLTAVFGGLVVFVFIILYKEFVIVSFDSVLAATLRLPVERLDYLLFVLMAVTIVVSLQTVGVALMVAMLVTPAATAYLLTNRLPVMTLLAALIGTVSGVVGLYVSFYLEVASGAAIVLVCTGVFALVFLFAPRRGRRWRQRLDGAGR
jgi:manganese/iron transport system permease protein